MAEVFIVEIPVLSVFVFESASTELKPFKPEALVLVVAILFLSIKESEVLLALLLLVAATAVLSLK